MSRILALVAAIVAGLSLHAVAQQAGVAASARAAAQTRTSGARLLPGTRPGVSATIQGNALNSTNGILPNTVVRLRDARLGQIVDTQLTDKAGLFTFRIPDPGTFIVEAMGPNSNVIAASQLLHVNAGEAVSAVVKLPFRLPPFGGLLGNSAPSAATVTSAAATSGVLAVTTAGEPASP